MTLASSTSPFNNFRRTIAPEKIKSVLSESLNTYIRFEVGRCGNKSDGRLASVRHLRASCRQRVTIASMSCGRRVRSVALICALTAPASCVYKSNNASKPIPRSAFAFLYSMFSSSVLFITTFSASENESDHLFNF